MNSIKGSLKVISSILDLLNKIDDASYKKPLPIFSGSTLGNHFRHILDFYNCLINGIDNGLIDYAVRERNPAIEMKTDAAYRAFEKVGRAITKLEDHDPLVIRADFSGEYRPLVDSTVGRELMFAFDHAIHHLAMVKIGLNINFPQIEIDENLGVAPSTVKNKKAHKAPVMTGS